MTQSRKEKLKRIFFITTMAEARENTIGKQQQQQVVEQKSMEQKSSTLSVEGDKSEIISVPFTILEVLFSKAKVMLGKMWKIRGMEKSWMAPSAQNSRSPHTVKH
jgi:hypothetical protein